MRQIIFRSKTLYEGEWVQGDLLQINEGSVCIGVHGQYIDDGMHFNDMYNKTPYIDENTICQYTNVDDINGKRIFEGDIVKVHCNLSINGYVGYIKYQNGCFGVVFDKSWMDFHPLHLTSKVEHDMGAQLDIEYSFEVLGNIFDDSQILAN